MFQSLYNSSSWEGCLSGGKTSPVLDSEVVQASGPRKKELGVKQLSQDPAALTRQVQARLGGSAVTGSIQLPPDLTQPGFEV